MTYEKLLIEADAEGITTKEKDLVSANGRIKGERIAIRKDISTVQKACAMAEELGHYYTTVGDIVELKSVNDYKQERKARLWAYNKLIGLYGIVSGYKARCRNLYDLAQHLEVTESFLQEALDCYRSKYGATVELDNHIIFFEPSLSVMEKL
ncbi:MAG: ImmA/IrrE family metallo-endopeptidase [Lachnospiraceae bacterium]